MRVRSSVLVVAPQALPQPCPRPALDLPAAHLRLVIGVVVAGRQAVEPDLGPVRVLHFVGMRECQGIGGVAEVDEGPRDLVGYKLNGREVKGNSSSELTRDRIQMSLIHLIWPGASLVCLQQDTDRSGARVHLVVKGQSLLFSSHYIAVFK